jgi:hypothetical protein
VSLYGVRVLTLRAGVEALGLAALDLILAASAGAAPGWNDALFVALLTAGGVPVNAVERLARGPGPRLRRELAVAAAPVAALVVAAAFPFVFLYAQGASSGTWAAARRPSSAPRRRRRRRPGCSSSSPGRWACPAPRPLARTAVLVLRLEGRAVVGVLAAVGVVTTSVLAACLVTFGEDPAHVALILGVLAFGALFLGVGLLGATFVAEAVGSHLWGWPDSRSDDALWHM